MNSGEEYGCKTLSALDPSDVCARTGSEFNDDTGLYHVMLCSHPVDVDPVAQEMAGRSPEADVMLSGLGYFAKLSILSYLVNAKDLPLSGDFVKLLDLTGNEAYSSGSHALPVGGLAGRYGADKSGFESVYRRIGGEPAEYGDAAMRIEVLGGIAVLVILWEGDDEFPARADLLVDRTSGQQVPLDILWSVAMLIVLFGLKA
jgi:hypothetical protein